MTIPRRPSERGRSVWTLTFWKGGEVDVSIGRVHWAASLAQSTRSGTGCLAGVMVDSTERPYRLVAGKLIARDPMAGESASNEEQPGWEQERK